MFGNVEAQTATTLYTFTNPANGSTPEWALAQGRDGALYGTTVQGGANTCTANGQSYGCGAIFRLDTSGSFTLLHSFDGDDGSGPQGIILGSDGDFYGAAGGGGSNNLGTLYKITQSGVFTKLHDFGNASDGEYPTVQLIQASDGNLYGLSVIGLYRATTSGTVTTLFAFSRPPYFAPAPLIQTTNGYLLATLGNEYFNGKVSTCGALVKFSLQGAQISEHDFSCLGPDGNSPIAPFIQAADGNFYGTTSNGGTGTLHLGTALEVDAASYTTTLLHNFGQDSGLPWNGLTQGSDGNFYGAVPVSTLSGSGSAYELTAGGIYTELAGLPYVGEDFPAWQLVQHTNGEFYGCISGIALFTTTYFGSVYAVDNGLSPFITFVAPQGRVDSRVQILGQGLTGASAVTFNGVPAGKFTVLSDTFMTAFVPAGASSGTIVVTTPSGALTSNKSFRVSLW
jgi:uncharacterized repeat protein (TIGR03803 family)